MHPTLYMLHATLPDAHDTTKHAAQHTFMLKLDRTTAAAAAAGQPSARRNVEFKACIRWSGRGKGACVSGTRSDTVPDGPNNRREERGT